MCGQCSGKGGFDVWDKPSHSTHMHYKRACPTCSGCGYTQMGGGGGGGAYGGSQTMTTTTTYGADQTRNTATSTTTVQVGGIGAMMGAMMGAMAGGMAAAAGAGMHGQIQHLHHGSKVHFENELKYVCYLDVGMNWN